MVQKVDAVGKDEGGGMRDEVMMGLAHPSLQTATIKHIRIDEFRQERLVRVTIREA